MAASRKKHLSISQLNTIGKCGEMWRQRYVLGIRKPPGVAMIIGSSVDAPISANMISKALDHKLLPEETIMDLASDKADETWEAVELNADEKKLGRKIVQGQTKDMIVNLSLLHARKLAPIIEPKMYATEEGPMPAVQRWFRLELEGYDYDLVGVMDLQEEGCIRDTKTAGKAPSWDEVHHSIQLTAYALAAEVIDHEVEPEVRLDVLVKKKTPEALSLNSRRGKADYESLLRRIEMASLAIDKGVFIPANQGDWWCSKKWCGYYSDCKYVRRSKLVQIK